MSRLGLLVALLACALLGWLIWTLLTGLPETSGHREEAPPATAESLPGSTTTETPPSESRAAPIAARPFRETAEAGEAPAAGSQPARRGRKLYVVLAPNDTPATGAIVDFVGIDSDEEFTQLFNEGDFALRAPTELVADAEGVVQLPRFKVAASVVGRSGDLRGRAEVHSGFPMRATLRLVPPLMVLVVDEAGRPEEDVPVAVVTTGAWPGTTRERSVTDRRGMALLVPPEVEKPRSGKKAAEETSYAVGIAIPLAEAVESPFDPANVPTTPLMLVLPPTGRVTVRLVGPDGNAFLGKARVQISPGRSRRAVFPGRPIGAVYATSTTGTVTFPHVGRSESLTVRATPEDRMLRAAEASIKAPLAGAESVVTLACGGLATVVTGRLVTSAGKPLAKVRFDAWLPAPSERQRDESDDDFHDRFRTTASDGGFKARFDLDPALVTAAELHLSVYDKPPPGILSYVHRPQALEVPLPPSIRTGSVDLGDVVVADLDGIASGRVVSKEGAPVPLAEVKVMQREHSRWDNVPGSHEVERPAGTDGRFELRGKVTGTDLGLVATRDGWVCVEPVPFDVGAKDLKVVMTKAGGLSGSIKGLGDDSGTSDSPVEVLVTGSEARITARNVQAWRRNDGRLELDLRAGKFKTRELLQGTYTVQIRARSSEDPLLVVDGIVVKAGEITRDPRIQEIELGGLMRSRVVTVLDDRGKAIVDARVTVVTVRDGSRDFARFETGTDGRAVVATQEASIDLVVGKAGYRAATVANVTGDATVTLKKAAPLSVTIRLDDSVELPAPPFFLTTRLAWLCAPDEKRPSEQAWGDPRNDWSGTRFGTDRTVTLTVDNPGVYEVDLSLLKELPRGSSSSGVDQKGGTATVTLGEDGSASVTVKVDADVLKQAIEEAKKE